MTQRAVVFDITRLATRVSRPVPNGIDRVDIGYARHFLSHERGGLGALLGPNGPRAVDNAAAADVVAMIQRHWQETGHPDDDEIYRRVRALLENDARSGPCACPLIAVAAPAADARRSIAALLRGTRVLGRSGLFPGRPMAATAPEGAVYLNTCQFPLWIDWYFRWLDRRPDMKAVFFIHDLLPIELPELFPAAEFERHSRRMEVLARRAAGVIVASEQTREALVDRLRASGRVPPPIACLPLPVDETFLAPATAPAWGRSRPYFVAVGTIEPRKNHLLLLNIWREIAERLGAATPRLLLVGLRGWENENVIDMLERCDRIRTSVTELRGISTPALRQLMAGARAVLLPTLAEGYGLPAAEAASAGVPLIASHIGPFTAYPSDQAILLDPLDGPGWQRAILAQLHGSMTTNSTSPSSTESALPTWAWHLKHADDFIQSL